MKSTSVRFTSVFSLSNTIGFIGTLSAIIGCYSYYEQKTAPVLAAYEMHDVVLSPQWAKISKHSMEGVPRINGIISDNIDDDSPQINLVIFKIVARRSGYSKNLTITLPDVTRYLTATARLDGFRKQIVTEDVKADYNNSKSLLTLSGLPELLINDSLYVYVWADYASFGEPKIYSSNEMVKTVRMRGFSGIASFLATFWVWGIVIFILLALWGFITKYLPKRFLGFKS